MYIMVSLNGNLSSIQLLIAPELFSPGATYTEKCDIYSLSIILWELMKRILEGKYFQPYKDEYTKLKLDYQIFYQVSANNLRPTIPNTCPEALKSLIQQCWDREPENRPSASELFDQITTLTLDFQQNTDSWNYLCK